MRIALIGREIRVAVCSAVALGLAASVASAATINSLTANSATVGKYETYEITFQLSSVSPSDYNPFRPETTGDSLSPAGIDVRADVITPSGATVRVNGFYDIDYAYLGNASDPDHTGIERMVPTSAPHWHVRYAPTQVGVHRVTVKVTDASGTASSFQLSFTCVESGREGFVKVSSDGRRLVYSDGSPFVPFGMMCPYGSEKVASTVSSMKANGMNFLRRWLVDRDKEDIFREMESWSSSTSYDGAVYRTGKRSAVKTVTGTGTLVDQSFIGCKPNTYYKAFGYFRTSSTFNGEVAVYVVEHRADESTTTRTGAKIGGGRTWAYSEVIFKTAANAEMLHFKPRILSGSTGTVWIDDAGLYECDSAGNILVNTNMVFNPSFEEWTPARLRMIPLARLEYLLQQCEANGIVVQPCIFNYRLWNKTSPTGFYYTYFGDWWTEPASIAQQDRALRYLVARFGHYRSLFAWELTNEMDSSYTDVRGAWITGRANHIRACDPYDHMITNSYWNSPADYEYAQMDEIDLCQVHYYINTEERTTGQGYPTWWTLSSGMAMESNSSNAASGSKALKATADGTTISDEATIYCKPSRSYTLAYRIKTSSVSGQASVIVRPFGGASAGSTITLNTAGTTSYTTRTQTFSTGSTAVGMTLTLQLTGSSGTAWWDEISLTDNMTGRNLLYNGGFECAPFGDDEFEWAAFSTHRSNQTYNAGSNGTQKPWASGEFGLMGADYDISLWAKYGDTTRPRHDTTGIHAHNCIWAQMMASSALNSPTYWWVSEYILPYNLYNVWKGATTLAANLPFYGDGECVSTDAVIAECPATSSSSRIRVIGQKNATSGYFWIQNGENSWSRVVREGLSPTPTSATITVPEFEDGPYTASWYDTYTGNLTATETKSVSGGTITLNVSALSKDTAVIVRKSASSGEPSIGLTLSVNKGTATPGEELSYTITYRNNGSSTATNVSMRFPVPENTTYVSGSASGGGTYNSGDNSVRWTILSLAPGASGQCTVRVKVM